MAQEQGIFHLVTVFSPSLDRAFLVHLGPPVVKGAQGQWEERGLLGNR